MRAHEFQVAHHCPQILPAGEAPRVDHQPVQLAVRLDMGVDVCRDMREVVSRQRPFGADDEDALFLA